MDIDATFFDIVHDTIGKGGQLFALMAHLEARNGPLTLFGDVVWERLGMQGRGVTTRNLERGVAGLGAAVTSS